MYIFFQQNAVKNKLYCQTQQLFFHVPLSLLFKDGDRWADIYVTEVIDACHFWAHVGGKVVIEKIEAINRKLLSQV